MAHESFENEDIADIMNQHYICIKVDREERPDVDQVYMEAVQLITGSGGWPLNCFALPDGRPVYGGTYFRPEQWSQLLLGLNETFQQEPDRVYKAASDITLGINSQEVISKKQPEIPFPKAQLESMVANWKQHFDPDWGGNQQAPKFPMPNGLEFLLSYAVQVEDAALFTHVNRTLTKMALGGIYDQVGGGFARYSVDSQWKVPHFEKMLYDNGQLISLYSNAYKATKNHLFKRIVFKTLQFIKREMTSPEGGFYSSYDADSEGVEGKFYVWEKAEIEALLGTDARWFCDYFNVTDSGNWEGANILWVTSEKYFGEKANQPTEFTEFQLDEALNKLFEYRKNRIRPALDDKILVSWNALMSLGYLTAFEAFGSVEFKASAIKNGNFIVTNFCQPDGSLLRNFKTERATIPGFLDDYALTIQLFIRLYQNTFDESWIQLAQTLTEYTIQNFYDENSGFFFFTNKLSHDLIVRKLEISDNVIPASNSIMANNLFMLGTLFSNNDWKQNALQMLNNVMPEMESKLTYYSNWGTLLLKVTQPFYEVVICGKEAMQRNRELTVNYLPQAIICGAITNDSNIPLLKNRWVENATNLYICVENTCKLPVKTVNEVLSTIAK